MRFNVAVSQGSTLVLRTIVGADRGAKACAEAGSSCNGMAAVCGIEWEYIEAWWLPDQDDVSDAMDGRRLNVTRLNEREYQRNMSQRSVATIEIRRVRR